MRNLFRALCCLLFVLFICSTQTASKMLVSPPSGEAPANQWYSEPFTYSDQELSVDDNWTKYSASSATDILEIVSNELYRDNDGGTEDYMALVYVYQSAASGVDQCFVIEFDEIGTSGSERSNIGPVFRSKNGDGEAYFMSTGTSTDQTESVNFNVGHITSGEWGYDATIASGGSFTYADGEYKLYCVTGTGTANTKAYFWDYGTTMLDSSPADGVFDAWDGTVGAGSNWGTPSVGFCDDGSCGATTNVNIDMTSPDNGTCPGGDSDCSVDTGTSIGIRFYTNNTNSPFQGDNAAMGDVND